MSEPVSPRVAQLRVVRDRYRREARQYAAKVRELIELQRLFGEDHDGLVLELAGTARMGQDRTAGEPERARRLHEHYPRALVLLGRGELLVATPAPGTTTAPRPSDLAPASTVENGRSSPLLRPAS